MKKIISICLIGTFLFSCASPDNQKKDTAKNTDSTKSIAKKDIFQDTGYLKFIDDSVEIPSFEIEVSLSAKANTKLKAAKETIIVAAYFSGIPKDTTTKEYAQSGEFSIASSQKEIRITSPVAKFEGIKFSRSAYDSLASKNIMLLINVYSGRRSTVNNLLDCDILQDSMSVIKGRKFVLKGKLIGE